MQEDKKILQDTRMPQNLEQVEGTSFVGNSPSRANFVE